MPEQNDIDQQILADIAAEEITRKKATQAPDPQDRLARLESMVTRLVESKGLRPAPAADGYERERLALLEDEQKIASFAASLSGSAVSRIVTSYGAAQLVLKPEWGNERVNGVVLIRAHTMRAITQHLDANKKVVSAELEDTLVGEPWWEVWGYLEPNSREKIGLLVTFPAAAVSCLVSLRSDMHVKPE